MKAVPDTDLTGAAIKLDESINQIDALPLLSGERMLDRTPGEGNKPAPAAPKGARRPRLPAPGGNMVSRLWTTCLTSLAR
jgi:uroporphyrinogen III methyltransferase/synthase